MTTKAQQLKADRITRRMAKALPEVAVAFVYFDEEGWLIARYIDDASGTEGREYYSPSTAGMTVAQLAEMVIGWVKRQLPEAEAQEPRRRGEGLVYRGGLQEAHGAVVKVMEDCRCSRCLASPYTPAGERLVRAVVDLDGYEEVLTCARPSSFHLK